MRVRKGEQPESSTPTYDNTIAHATDENNIGNGMRRKDKIILTPNCLQIVYPN